MASRKVERLKKVILRRASDVILFELHDPRLGFVTLSKVDLGDDLRHAVIYYSIIGADADRSKTAHALRAARGYVQNAIAGVMKTRVTPQIRFKYDESIEGSMRVAGLIDKVVAADEAMRAERETEKEPGETSDPEEPADEA